MSVKDQERWKRLAALGAKGEIPTPEGEARMSAVIMELAEPLIRQRGKTPQRAESIIMLTIAGWNKSMFPPEKQPMIEKDLIDAFVPKDGSAEAVAVAMEIMDLMAERRENLYPDLRKVIVDYEVKFDGGRLTLNVTSAPIPDVELGKIQDAVATDLSDKPRYVATARNAKDRSEIVSRYKHLRAVGRNLNHKLVKRLSKDVLSEGGKRLGIFQRGTLIFNSEDESAVLMDYCIYDVRRKGRNAVEQYLIDSAPAPESDEMACLRAMQQAIYSLFVVESVIRGFGVVVRDLLSSETNLVVDMGFGSTAEPGLVFASRLLFHEGFAITGGAALPIGVLPEDQREAVTRELARAVKADTDGRFDPAQIIRSCLRQGCSSHVQYQEPTGRLIGRHRASDRVAAPEAGRNAPCPCGSGKKFKTCCMKKMK
ncbi:MAG: SEC-C domain-containing protein [Planctomycetaceae bacterium]|nr:SEC-C domain-containing protein [Planctomycetaceae bacterium]